MFMSVFSVATLSCGKHYRAKISTGGYMQIHQLAEGAKGLCKAVQPTSNLAHGHSWMIPQLFAFGLVWFWRVFF